MEYRILGPLEVVDDGRVIPLGPPKQRAVLAILLLHAGEVVSADRLIELAWGEHPPRTAPHSVQIYVSELRKVLDGGDGAPAIATRPPGYELAVDVEQIDARRFERLLGEGARDLASGNASAAASATDEALRLWTGPPLSDFSYEEFAQGEINRLVALRVDALEQLAAADLELGRAQEALAAAETAVGEDPFRERGRELRMRALYRSGRHPEALRAYQQFNELLRDELGLEPSPDLQQLWERMLLHDPSLAPGAPVAVGTREAARNPYKGLRSFTEDDAGDFFGREPLVDELLAALRGGRRLVALVGPSGSGKSSVLQAGLLPALRAGRLAGSEHWPIARMVPGSRPTEALAAALARALGGPPSAPEEAPPPIDEDPMESARRDLPQGGRLLLAIDQFEELFTVSDEDARDRFIRDLTSAATGPDDRITVLLALRADYYDRPLLQPEFASAFAAGVVNVVPMAAEDIEAAVVRPAQRVGLEVDPALLARLTADTADRPGALPLLQYTLTELFDHRSGNVLALPDYEAMGGLRQALSRRAEALYGRLDDDRRRIALQLFLRLGGVGAEGRLSARRVAVGELATLGLDPVELSGVLDAFGGNRLLSFARDPIAGNAIVAPAHEALLWEWDRLRGWLETHAEDVRQHDALVGAMNEWEAAGRDPDYLLMGSRLAGYESWSRTSTLQLSLRERGFLDAGIARRRAEEEAEADQRDRQRRLERRARVRLWGLLAAIAVLAGAATFGLLTWLGNGPPDVALVFEGTGDMGFGDMAAAGFNGAVAELGLHAEVRRATGLTNEVEDELRQLSDRGVGLVVEGHGPFAEGPTAAVANAHPGTRYVVWEFEGDLPNVTNLTFRSEEASYLAGAAAALTSRTGVIGWIGAFKIPLIEAYLAGYEAGAHHVNPAIEIRIGNYLSTYPDFSGVASPELGLREATRLYADGVDVIFAVAGTSERGVFEAATSGSSALGRQLWAIGVDTDAYDAVVESTEPMPSGQDARQWRQHILSSVTKRLDVAIAGAVRDYAQGTLAPGVRWLGLAEGGVDISYRGGFLDADKAVLEDMRKQIISGEIPVPTIPIDATDMPEP